MTPHLAPLEMWGGIECTVNRVGDQRFDQLERNGHAHRPDDIARIAALGIRTLRYPLLWERLDWDWADERMRALSRHGIRPIVGLIHHGSGLADTSLVDSAFAPRLADYARQVAERYPDVELWTPVNEPLTTARFAGLYGHWYPHGRDARTFARCFVNQCQAIVLAMREIRRVRPDARLVQTEDLGRATGTPPLHYQASFENERRWLTFDLLSGRVVYGHPLWDYLREAGVRASELAWFADNPCPPDILGINHYLTSERFLDHRLDRYPANLHGNNGRHAYADVEAVRVCPEGLAGPKTLLRETWERYRRPIAVTETHLGCTREEQLRWLAEVWRAAQSLRRDGVDIQAVTAWSLFGAFDWDSLVTLDRGHYEPGSFDIRSDPPRPTALAGLIAELAAGREPTHPVLDVPGWWRRPSRLLFGHRSPRHGEPLCGRPILILGGTGSLAQAFARACEERGLPCRLWTRQKVDLGDAVGAVLVAEEPWAVVNVASYHDVDEEEELGLVQATLDLLIDGWTCAGGRAAAASRLATSLVEPCLAMLPK